MVDNLIKPFMREIQHGMSLTYANFLTTLFGNW